MDSKIKKTIKFYDDYAKQYADFSFPKISQYYLTHFISFLNGKKVLDAGCGAGRDVDYLTSEGFDVTGIDASEKMLRMAKKNVKANFRKMDMTEKLKFKDASFDGIWCCASLLHVKKKTVPNVLKEFNRILKKEGIVYISVKEGEGEKILDSELIPKAPLFYSFYKQHEVEELLEEAGFELITSYPDKTPSVVWLHFFARKI